MIKKSSLAGFHLAAFINVLERKHLLSTIGQARTFSELQQYFLTTFSRCNLGSECFGLCDIATPRPALATKGLTS
jgi:hypothetical protein